MLEAIQDNVRKRKILSAEKKYQIVEEIKRNPGRKAEILRREGLYSSDILRFERIIREGGIKALKECKSGKKRLQEVSYEEYASLQRELAKKENALAELSVELVALKKKVNGE